MTSSPPAGPPLDQPLAPRATRSRGLVAWALVIIAAILMPLAVVAFWGQRTLTDAERYLATVAPLVEQQEVKDAVVQVTTETLMTTIENNDVVQDAAASLPPIAANTLLPALTGAVESLVSQVTTRIVNSDQFAQLWVVANTELQKNIVAALSGEGGSDAITLEGDQIVLNTAPVAEAAKQELISRGLTALDGVALPPEAQQKVVLLDAPEVAQAQVIYAFTIPIAQYLIPVLGVLVLVGTAISARRARLLMGFGISITLGMSMLIVGLTIARGFLVDAAPTSGAQTLLDLFWDALTRFLVTAVWAWLVAGIALALVAWFGGRSRPATAVRGTLSSALLRAGRPMARGPLSGVGAFLESHWRAVFVGISVVALLGLLSFDPLTAWDVVLVVLLALGVAAGVTLLRGARALPLVPPAQ